MRSHYNLGCTDAKFVQAFPGNFHYQMSSELDQILAGSRAAESFKTAVRRFCDRGRSEHARSEHIRIDGFAPAIKVRRLLTQVLSSAPELPIERVELRGKSGCSDFAGIVHVHTESETHVYEFVWDCRWRAEQEGWTDCFGLPDQIRAAQVYDWRCFERWERRGVEPRRSDRLE